MQNLTIRAERKEDQAAVRRLVEEAFAAAEHSDGDEQDLVERLRNSAAYIPELSLVAEADGAVVGHIMFTAVNVGETAALALAPLAVAPAMQGRGVGGALIREGHRIARDMGYGFSILVGHAGYYPRFGYRPAASFGIRQPFDVPEENAMACDLRESGGRLEGVVEYAREFFTRQG